MAEIETDYLVIGAGASGMAFTDALIENADVSVVMVDRRHSVGGHWLDEQLGIRFPIFLLTGLLLVMAGGALAIRRLINRFLATFKD